MATIRQERVQELILREISKIFQLKTSEWFQGVLLTVTKVNVPKDFSIAKIYISIFGKESHKEILDIIKAHSKEIRYSLGSKINTQLRIIPELIFYEDDSLDYIENIDRLLKE